MTAIPDELIEQVRDSADVVHLIGEHVELKRMGTDHRGPCPFHGGQKRNFSVSPKKQMFYCFVCHEGGDIFHFFMKHFGMDYPTAVRDVAGRLGIVIPDRSTAGPDPREPLFSAVAVAGEWYAARLRDAPDGEIARKYLEKRGFSVEECNQLGLGFAPKGKPFLEAMEALGISSDVLSEAGLIVKREDGSVRPRFWGRLLFPIHDLRGRIVGFGGRVLGDGEPKYLNSPESRIFHKRDLLYNLHAAKPAIRRVERAVVVEGYFDALRAVSAGVDYTVAPLGTALTTEQVALLKRYAKEVVLLYDNDPAGNRASFRAAEELLRAGVRSLIATLPDGEDPDSLVGKGGPEALRAVVEDALDVFERMLQLVERKGWFASLAGRRRALDRLLPALRATQDPVTMDLYISRAAEAVGVTTDSIRREMHMVPGRRAPTTRPRQTRDAEPASAGDTNSPERNITRVLAREPKWRARIRELVLDPSMLSQPDRELFRVLAAQPPDVGGAQLLSQVDGIARTVLESVLREDWGELDVDALIDGSLRSLESRGLAAELSVKQREISMVPEERKKELAREIDALSRRLNKLKPGRWNVIHTGRGSAG